MCTGFEWAMVGLGATSTLASLSQGKGSTPQFQAPKEPQAAKVPDQAGARASASQAVPGAAASAGSTMLTGPGGAAPSLLNIGKNKLLGGGG